MTTYNKNTLKTFFETGDVPTGQNFADLIDSCVNMVDTGVQAMGGALNPTELITARVSAGDGLFTGNVSISGILSANVFSQNVVNAVSVSAGSINSVGNISASAASVYASAGRFNAVYQPTGTVSALGSTQATAAPLAFVINRGRGVADGQTTGFTPLTNNTGLVQYLLNEGASANLWPPVGGFINGLAVNTPFPLVASAAYTIFHITASSYGVK